MKPEDIPTLGVAGRSLREVLALPDPPEAAIRDAATNLCLRLGLDHVDDFQKLPHAIESLRHHVIYFLVLRAIAGTTASDDALELVWPVCGMTPPQLRIEAARLADDLLTGRLPESVKVAIAKESTAPKKPNPFSIAGGTDTDAQ